MKVNPPDTGVFANLITTSVGHSVGGRLDLWEDFLLHRPLLTRYLYQLLVQGRAQCISCKKLEFCAWVIQIFMLSCIPHKFVKFLNLCYLIHIFLHYFAPFIIAFLVRGRANPAQQSTENIWQGLFTLPQEEVITTTRARNLDLLY